MAGRQLEQVTQLQHLGGKKPRAMAKLIAGADFPVLGRHTCHLDGAQICVAFEPCKDERDGKGKVTRAEQRRVQFRVERREFFRRRLLGLFSVWPEALHRLCATFNRHRETRS